MPGGTAFMLKLTLGAVLIWLVLDRTAFALGSLRGEWGLVACAAALAATVLAQRLLFGTSWREMPDSLGLTAGNSRALLATCAVALVMLAYFPAFSAFSGSKVFLVAERLLLLPGLFAQHGIAEETLFRGFVLGHLRRRLPFWPAAWWSLVPFTAAHLMLFTMMEPVLAASSTLVAVATSIPLAWLYEQGGRTIWAAALLHLAVHAIKLVEVDEAHYMPFALGWMAVCATVPYLVFLTLRPRVQR